MGLATSKTGVSYDEATILAIAFTKCASPPPPPGMCYLWIAQWDSLTDKILSLATTISSLVDMVFASGALFSGVDFWTRV